MLDGFKEKKKREKERKKNKKASGFCCKLNTNNSTEISAGFVLFSIGTDPSTFTLCCSTDVGGGESMAHIPAASRIPTVLLQGGQLRAQQQCQPCAHLHDHSAHLDSGCCGGAPSCSAFTKSPTCRMDAVSCAARRGWAASPVDEG